MTRLARRLPAAAPPETYSVCTKTMDGLVPEVTPAGSKMFWFIFIFQGPFYWFLQEKDLLSREELNWTKLAWTNNITRDPLLICLGKGLTQDGFEKPNFVKTGFLSFVVDCRIPEGWCVFVELYSLLFLVNIIWSSRTLTCKKATRIKSRYCCKIHF